LAPENVNVVNTKELVKVDISMESEVAKAAPVATEDDP
jgi:hypothetical protein